MQRFFNNADWWVWFLVSISLLSSGVLIGGFFWSDKGSNVNIPNSLTAIASFIVAITAVRALHQWKIEIVANRKSELAYEMLASFIKTYTKIAEYEIKKQAYMNLNHYWFAYLNLRRQEILMVKIQEEFHSSYQLHPILIGGSVIGYFNEIQHRIEDLRETMSIKPVNIQNRAVAFNRANNQLRILMSELRTYAVLENF